MNIRILSDFAGLSVATINRRHDAAIQAMRTDGDMEKAIAGVMEQVNGKQESSRK
jgi:hypothetical protein